MTLVSMTGFARADGALEALRWHWEIKSVNGRALELRFRLPPGYDGLEPKLKQAAGDALRRGNVQAALVVDASPAAERIVVNRELLAELRSAVAELQRTIAVDLPRADGLLALRGVLEVERAEESEAQRAAREAAVLESFVGAVARLQSARADEGAKLHAILSDGLARIEALTKAAESVASRQPEALKVRLRDQVAALLEARVGVSEERLAQEAALLATKADVREEIDRLHAHVAQAHALLAGAEPAGRRLDFLAQEFNREANTLCSKAWDVELTRIGLELKAAIEQFREQVQNVE